jgi:pentatricopeptide repeat protein
MSMLARPLRHAAFALVLLTPALGVAQKALPPAAPDTDRQTVARAKAQEGLRLFGEDHWADALAAFREAEALTHAPSITIYVARCLRKLGKMFEARDVYQQILARDLPPDAPAQFVTARNDAGKELEFIRQNIPTVRVEVLGATGPVLVMVNGGPIGSDPKELDPGGCTVEVKSAAGAVLGSQTVTLKEGSKEVVTIDLRPPPTTWRSSPVPGAVALGVGGVGAIVGGIFGGLALKQASDVKAVCTMLLPASCAPELSQKNASETKAWVANVGFGVAIVGVVTGAVLLATRSSPKARAAVHGALGPGGVTLHF